MRYSAYGLPKIHKTDYPLRIIVSSLGSPLHNLASYLQKILQESLSILIYNYKNSFDVINKLVNMYIPEDHYLFRYDFVVHQRSQKHSY